MWDDNYKTRYHHEVPLAVHGYRCTVDSIINVYENLVIYDHSFVRNVWIESASPHNHEEFEVFCVLSGAATVRIDDQRIHASAGDILLVNPRQIHSVAPDSSQVPFQDMCINFDLTYFSVNSADRYCRTISYLPNSPLADCIRGQVQQIITAYQEEKSGWEWEVKGHLYLMFSQLITNRAAWFERPEETQEDTFLTDISSYIGEHLHEVLRVDRIAAQFSYSTAYFCRLFKKTFACTFTEYVNRQRIITAKRMLDNGMYSISEVANAVGINNYSYFSKLFREQVGLLPSDYQKHLQKIKKL